MGQIELELEDLFSSMFRRIWVQRHSRKNKNDVVITLFPISLQEDYQIIVARDLQSICFEEVSAIINSSLNK